MTYTNLRPGCAGLLAAQITRADSMYGLYLDGRGESRRLEQSVGDAYKLVMEVNGSIRAEG